MCVFTTDKLSKNEVVSIFGALFFDKGLMFAMVANLPLSTSSCKLVNPLLMLRPTKS